MKELEWLLKNRSDYNLTENDMNMLEEYYISNNGTGNLIGEVSMYNPNDP